MIHRERDVLRAAIRSAAIHRDFALPVDHPQIVHADFSRVFVKCRRMRQLPRSVGHLQHELVEADVEHIGIQANFRRDLLIARLRVPAIDQNAHISRMKAEQVDADIERFQIDVGVDLVEAGIEAAVRAIVAYLGECV